jgi:hypothetical protein
VLAEKSLSVSLLTLFPNAAAGVFEFALGAAVSINPENCRSYLKFIFDREQNPAGFPTDY